MDTTSLWVWYENAAEEGLQGGHVAAWKSDMPMDEQGTPTGPAVIGLAGLADPIVAATLVESARAEGSLVWLSPDIAGSASLDNLVAVWGDDIVYAAITYKGSNPTVSGSGAPALASVGGSGAGAEPVGEAS